MACRVVSVATTWTHRGLIASHVWRGGDATTLHNGVRDVYFDFCERAGLRPISGAPNILLDVFTLDGRCRPADILCIPALALARVLPNGARAVRTEPVCMDIAVINAPGQDHWRHTAVRAGSAADVYSAASTPRLQLGARHRPLCQPPSSPPPPYIQGVRSTLRETLAFPGGGRRPSRRPAQARDQHCHRSYLNHKLAHRQSKIILIFSAPSSTQRRALLLLAAKSRTVQGVSTSTAQ